MVRTERGGGKHNVPFYLKDTYDTVMNKCKALFWDRRKPKDSFGNENKIQFYLVDNQKEVINQIITANEKQLPFTIGNYVKQDSLVRNSIYFRSKNVFQYMSHTLDEYANDSDEFEPSINYRNSTPMSSSSVQPSNRISKPDSPINLVNSDTSLIFNQPSSSGIIGSFAER